MKQIMAQTLMFTGFFKVSSLHDPGNAGVKDKLVDEI